MNASNARYAKNMHCHFKILLIQVKNSDEKKLFMEQFEEAFLARDKKRMWVHVGALVKYNREQIDAKALLSPFGDLAPSPFGLN